MDLSSDLDKTTIKTRPKRPDWIWPWPLNDLDCQGQIIEFS